MIYFIRHAESEANINIKTQSHADICLSTHGEKQALALCTQLPKIDRIIVSTYLRTQQTALPLAQKYHLNLEVNPLIHEFSYLSVRKCVNTNMQERKAWANDYWQKMAVDYQDADDAESFIQLYQRVALFIQDLKHLSQQDAQQRNIAIFSHGQFLKLLMMQLQQHQTCSSFLMQQFHEQLLNHPIANTQIIPLLAKLYD